MGFERGLRGQASLVDMFGNPRAAAPAALPAVSPAAYAGAYGVQPAPAPGQPATAVRPLAEEAVSCHCSVVRFDRGRLSARSRYGPASPWSLDPSLPCSKGTLEGTLGSGTKRSAQS